MFSTSSLSPKLPLPLKPPRVFQEPLLVLLSQSALALTAATPGLCALRTPIAIISATVTAAEMMLWMAHMDLKTIAWTRISMTARNRCIATTWLAGGVIEAVTVTGGEVSAGAVDMVGRGAADTDEGLTQPTITLTKAGCVRYTVPSRTSNTIYSVAVLRVHD